MKMEQASDTKSCIRAMTSEVSLLLQPDGSASFNQGDSSALVAIYGPAEVKMNRELIDRANLEVIYKPKVGLPGCEDKLVEHVVRNTCESIVRATLHPRTLLSIVIQEMQDSGSFLATCINATCLALLDACYPMYCCAAAVACVYTESDDLVIDPTAKQEKHCRAYFTFAFDGKDKNVLACETKGLFSKEDYTQALVACRQASDQIFTFYRETIKKKMSRTV